jgi:hypothetical protein
MLSVEKPCPYRVLNEHEKEWLILCFSAMTGKSRKNISKKYHKQAMDLAKSAAKLFEKINFYHLHLKGSRFAHFCCECFIDK